MGGLRLINIDVGKKMAAALRVAGAGAVGGAKMAAGWCHVTPRWLPGGINRGWH